MKISYNWLKTYVDTDLDPEKMAQILTDTGLEVEGLEQVGGAQEGMKGVVVGEVLHMEKHPDADRLKVTTLNIGSEDTLQVVCGAPNVDKGQKVLVATVGSTLHTLSGEQVKIKRSKIRGVESHGMICAEDELGIGESHEGIMVLDSETEVGTPAETLFQSEEDYLIEIGLTPNRADAMGHIGVARDLIAYLNYHEKSQKEIQFPSTDLIEGTESIDITVEHPEACPRYAGVVIKGVRVEESPEWLQNRLQSIGLSPINNLVDITNFVMHETGNPLHAFDLSAVGEKIIVRLAKSGEKITGLDEVERELHNEDLMICNSADTMCIAGVFGGIDSGVQSTTTDIFLEAAYFNPVFVRKTAKRHQLNTDSSFRFERGVDPNNILFALKRAASLIVEFAGGTVGKIQDHYPQAIEPFVVDFDYDRCRKLCGIEISNDEIKSILRELDIVERSADGSKAVMEVPTYRVDVRREADIIEEVLRIYGFNQVPLPEKMNTSMAARNQSNREKLYNLTANLLVDNGFSEIMNNSLTSSANWQKAAETGHAPNEDVHLLNPLSQELDVMRQTLLFGGLNSIEYNQNRQHPDLKFFEFGKVYRKDDQGYQETSKIGVWLSGRLEEEQWDSSNDSVSFYNLKGVVESIISKIGIDKAVSWTETESGLFDYGYDISITKKPIGTIGLVRKDISKKFGVKSEVFFADLNWDSIVALSRINKVNYKALPKTQFSRRDFSLLLNEEITFESIEKIAFSEDRKILKEVGLFDVYQGKNLEKGKKSYAVSFIFQDDEQTLTDEQIDQIMQGIRQKLETELKAELR